jgi:hypothetical protein
MRRFIFFILFQSYFAEYDELRIKEVEGQRRAVNGVIQSNSGPSSAAAAGKMIVRDRRPSTSTGGPAAVGYLHGATPSVRAAPEVHSVFLPQEKQQALLLENESLKARIGELEAHYRAKIDALVEDRRIREEELEARERHDSRSVSELLEELNREKEMVKKVTRDFYVHRHNAAEEAQRGLLEVTALKNRVAQVEAERDHAVKEARAEAKRQAQKVQAEASDYTEHFRRQATAREDDAKLLREELKATKAASEARIRDLEGKLARVTDRYKKLEFRRNSEVEGFASDIRSLKATLKAIQGNDLRFFAEPDVVESQNYPHERAQDLAEVKKRLAQTEHRMRSASAKIPESSSRALLEEAL